MSGIIVVLLGIIVAQLLWYAWPRKAPPPLGLPDEGIPETVSLRAQPLLTQAEAAFYNVLQLAVREQYLVFARVPLSSLVRIQPKDPKAIRLAAFLARKLSRRCADFVLVHPGTLDVAKVVELENGSDKPGGAGIHNGLAQQVFQETGIPLVRLNAHQAYTAPALASLLGVEPSD